MPVSTFILPNGLQIIHSSSPTDVAYCGYAVDAGTRDELPQEQGMAHFVEHLIFKGTKKRHAWHILNRMEVVGGDLNAYTNKEETVIYSASLLVNSRSKSGFPRMFLPNGWSGNISSSKSSKISSEGLSS